MLEVSAVAHICFSNLNPLLHLVPQDVGSDLSRITSSVRPQGSLQHTSLPLATSPRDLLLLSPPQVFLQGLVIVTLT